MKAAAVLYEPFRDFLVSYSSKYLSIIQVLALLCLSRLTPILVNLPTYHPKTPKKMSILSARVSQTLVSGMRRLLSQAVNDSTLGARTGDSTVLNLVLVRS